MMTAVWGRADWGCKKCDKRAVYEGEDEGTVYTDKRARTSACGGCIVRLYDAENR